MFVTKYRKKVITPEMLGRLNQTFDGVLRKWDGDLLEFNGEADHVHLLFSYPPHKLLSGLVANLKATSSKLMWRDFEEHISTFYSRKTFWTGSYFVASCGGVTIDVLKQYVQSQDCSDSSHQHS